jgi:hypothetical protein
MGDDIAKGMKERRRLHILQILADTPGYMMEASEIQAHLAALFFTAISQTALIGDLVMLRDLGLCLLLAEGTAAKLTAPGLEAAKGLASYPGVARPLPE